MTDSELRNFKVTGDEGSARLDRVLALHCADVSRSRLKGMILEGRVTVGPATIRDPAYHVAAEDTITIALPAAVSHLPEAETIALDIVHEDEDIIVINKPRGLVVHPAAGNQTGTLVNALIAHCGEALTRVGEEARPGIVHRLDKDTTGLMVAAKSERAYQSLTQQFADHGRTGALERGYFAFVWGVPMHPRGTITAPIDRHPRTREKMAVREDGREAITHWETVETYPGGDGKPVAALLACALETGRTHQIRVHLAHIGHPLLCDSVYAPGFKTKANQLSPLAREALLALNRQALHAYLLTIEHPGSGEIMHWEAPLPADMAALQQALQS